jgi:hypothetical protein
MRNTQINNENSTHLTIYLPHFKILNRLHEYKTLLYIQAIHGLLAALSDACFSISSSFRCLRILESIPSKLVVFFLALPLGPPSPVLLGVNFGADISSMKSKSDFSSCLKHRGMYRIPSDGECVCLCLCVYTVNL